jgi:DnaJ family protein C protein 3
MRRFPRSFELNQKIQQLERRIKQQSKVNYYKVLGLTRSCSQRDVKRAYHKLAMKYHPDKVTDAEEKPAAEAMFKKVARAYEVLGDEDLRKRYDAGEDVDDANAMNQRQQQQRHPFHGGGFPFGGGGGGRRTHHFYR